LNIKDERFQAIFDNHKFNIDPSDPSFKKTKAMEELVTEKQNRTIEKLNSKESTTIENKTTETNNNNTTTNNTALLIKSIKSKTEALKRTKKSVYKYVKQLK
jgi:hypothetical protein